MNEVTVIEIVNENAKQGHSDKTGKDWSLARVGFDNGQSGFVFNPVQVGDKFTVTEKDGYTNYVKVKPDPKHDELMKALREIYKQNKAILEALAVDLVPGTASAIKPADEAPVKPWDKAARQAKEMSEEMPDDFLL